jgi:hypothetical protein
VVRSNHDERFGRIILTLELMLFTLGFSRSRSIYFFFIGGTTRKKDISRNKKIFLNPTYRDVDHDSLSSCSQLTCGVYT